jgi:hypothetical protein
VEVVARQRECAGAPDLGAALKVYTRPSALPRFVAVLACGPKRGG